MRVSFKPIDRKILRIIKAVSSVADEKRIPVYVVGGFVRDLLLKKQTNDLDIIVEGDVLSFSRKLGQLFDAPIKSYPSFQTATLLLKDDLKIDLAAARKEIYAHPGALPKVARGALQDDLHRRDFTINAMALSINAKNFGELYDFHDGLGDLEFGKIRILHPQSFVDDPTRILRAVRYEQRFGFNIHRGTLKTLKKAIDDQMFSNISSDRYFNDFKKLLEEENVSKILKRMYQLNALVPMGEGVKHNFSKVRRIEKNFKLFRARVRSDGVPIWFIFILAILEGRSEQELKRITAQFDFTKSQTKSIDQLNRLSEVSDGLKICGRNFPKCYHELNKLPTEVVWYLKLTSINKNLLSTVDRYLACQGLKLHVNGYDLKAMGISSGKKVGEILRRIFESKLNGEVQTRRDELKLAKLISKNYQVN